MLLGHYLAVAHQLMVKVSLGELHHGYFIHLLRKYGFHPLLFFVLRIRVSTGSQHYQYQTAPYVSFHAYLFFYFSEPFLISSSSSSSSCIDRLFSFTKKQANAGNELSKYRLMKFFR